MSPETGYSVLYKTQKGIKPQRKGLVMSCGCTLAAVAATGLKAEPLLTHLYIVTMFWLTLTKRTQVLFMLLVIFSATVGTPFLPLFKLHCVLVIPFIALFDILRFIWQHRDWFWRRMSRNIERRRLLFLKNINANNNNNEERGTSC